MKEEVLKGNFQNKNFAYLVDRLQSDSHEYGTEMGQILFDIYIKPILSKKGCKRISKNRESIFLENVEDYEKKKIWQLNTNKNYTIYANYYMFSLSKDSSEDEIKEILAQQTAIIENLESKKNIKFEKIKIKPFYYEFE